ncbi:carboxymethylenebutenolidase domain protein [Burkholderia thailandensis H0587]|nr:carboxymethylenebutenolidase domain protein [Burkholderia thailandensis H0587]
MRGAGRRMCLASGACAYLRSASCGVADAPAQLSALRCAMRKSRSGIAAAFTSDERLTHPCVFGHRVRVPLRRGGRRRATRLHRAGRRGSNSCRRRVCRACATKRAEERIHVETRSRQPSSARSVQPPQVRQGGAWRHVRRGGAARVRADDHDRCRGPRCRHRRDPLGRRERAGLSRAAGRQEQPAGDRRDPRGVRRACAHRRHLPALREARLSGDRAGPVCAPGRSVEVSVDPGTDRPGGQQGA